jgi:hypothetical protein
MRTRFSSGPPDRIERSVLFAVEVVDPVRLSLVSQQIAIRAEGLSRSPILNLAGRFVWLEEGQNWPTTIAVIPDGLPFATQRTPTPARPIDLASATAEQRFLRVMLRPTAAYPFSTGVTAIRGQLREGPAPNAAPVPGVRVQLAWRDEHDVWSPAPPSVSDSDDRSPLEPETDLHGDFAVFLRMEPKPQVQPDLKHGMLRVRLQFTRGRSPLITRRTPDNFTFLPSAPMGCIPEGQLVERDLRFVWSDLVPI